jgi:hypothetical protein
MNHIRFLKGGSKKRPAETEDAGESRSQEDSPEPGADFTHPGADFMDHYKVLELSFKDSPSAKQIKKARDKLAKRYHPDKNGGEEAMTEKFQQINEAYHALSDEKVKEAFDAMCRAQAQREEGGCEKRTRRGMAEGSDAGANRAAGGTHTGGHAAKRARRSGSEKAAAPAGAAAGATGGATRRAPDADYTEIVQRYQSELARMREEQGLAVSSHQAKKQWEPPRPSVLLVDEVDVFFGNGFYGQPYQPSVPIDTDERDGYMLLKHIWQERDTHLKEGKRLFQDKIMKRLEVKKLQKVFPNLKEGILKR